MHRLALIGDFQPGFELHLATIAAVEHSRRALGVEGEAEWIETEAATLSPRLGLARRPKPATSACGPTSAAGEIFSVVTKAAASSAVNPSTKILSFCVNESHASA